LAYHGISIRRSEIGNRDRGRSIVPAPGTVNDGATAAVSAVEALANLRRFADTVVQG
jgi:hypothetical protein